MSQEFVSGNSPFEKGEEKMTQKFFLIKCSEVDHNHEEIEAPKHYVEGRTIEPIQIIEQWNLNHHSACALKYISRAGRKDDEGKDLRKAVWYLERRIKLIEKKQHLKE